MGPPCCNIFVNQTMKEYTPQFKKMHVVCQNLKRASISECAFEDNMVAGKEEKLKNYLWI